MAEPMSNERLAEIEARANRGCRCDDHDCVTEFVQLVDEDVPALLAEVKRLQAQRAELVELLGWHVDAEDDPCRLDHHGHCQAHGSLEDGPCRTAASRELLVRIRGEQQPEDGDRG